MTDEDTFRLPMEEWLDYTVFSSDLKVLLRIRGYNDGRFLYGRLIEEVIYWGA